MKCGDEAELPRTSAPENLLRPALVMLQQQVTSPQHLECSAGIHMIPSAVCTARSAHPRNMKSQCIPSCAEVVHIAQAQSLF